MTKWVEQESSGYIQSVMILRLETWVTWGALGSCVLMTDREVLQDGHCLESP